MKTLIFGTIALVLAGTLPGAAQTSRSENREYRQTDRIVTHALRGELTLPELRRLARQQQRIDRAQWRAARDGYVSPAERRLIERMQDRASRNIWRKSHNGRVVC